MSSIIPEASSSADAVQGTKALDPAADKEVIAELVAALKGVIAVADRQTVEFDRARAAITKATGAAQ